MLCNAKKRAVLVPVENFHFLKWFIDTGWYAQPLMLLVLMLLVLILLVLVILILVLLVLMD